MNFATGRHCVVDTVGSLCRPPSWGVENGMGETVRGEAATGDGAGIENGRGLVTHGTRPGIYSTSCVKNSLDDSMI